MVWRRILLRLFGLWLRLVAPRLTTEERQDVTFLFEERLKEAGVGGHFRIALGAMMDAWIQGRVLGVSAGMAPRRRARVEPLAHLRRDVRFAVRSLRRRPLFTGLAVLALGLGIGGATAMFSVVDGVLIKRLPYHDPEEVVNIWKAWPSWQGEEGLDYTWDHIQFPWVDYLNVRDNASTLVAVAGHAQSVRVLTGDGPAQELSVGEASANLFGMLGVPMVLGRPFAPDEVAPEGSPARVVILSHQLWASRYGQDPAVLGRTLLLGNESYEVIGVLPERFRLGSDLVRTHDNGGSADTGLRDLWMPLGTEGTDRGNSFELVGRLAEGATPASARDEVQGLMTHNDGHEDQVARVALRKEVLTRDVRSPLTVLLAAAGLLMVIACANVMGLLLGEGPARRTEVAARMALGAPGRRIVGQLLTENLILGLTGGALGLGLAWLGTDLLLATAPPLPRLVDVGIDVRVLLFVTGAALGTSLAFGLIPALDLSRSDLVAAMRNHTVDRRARALQSWSVIGQVALTLVLLVSAGLLGRSMTALLAVEPGFQPEGAGVVHVGRPLTRFTDADAALRHIDDVIGVAEKAPGVRSVTAASRIPFAGSNGTQGFSVLVDGETRRTTQLPMFVDADYLSVMGIPIVAGRGLTVADDRRSPRVMVVSRAWVEAYLGGRSPIGLRVSFRGGEPWTIVGVAEDVRHQSLGSPPEPTFYAPLRQVPRDEFVLLLRGEDPGAAILEVRAALSAAFPDLPVEPIGPIKSLMRSSEADDRFRAVLVGTFAALATLLAGIGVFGVTARSVSARRRELGIRATLGARVGALRALVLRDGLRSAAIGLVLGLFGAAAAARVIAHFLFGVSPHDPVAFAGAAALSGLVFFAAAYFPAARVTRIDPARIVSEP